MARYRIPGKHYTKRSMIGIALIVVAVAAIVAAAVAVAVLPGMVEGHEGSDLAAGTYVRPTVQAIVVENDGRISINADLTQVFATVQYSDGTSEQVALSEMIVEGLDLTRVQTLNNVVLDYGGFKQTVTYEVVPTTLTVTYTASYGGRIEGDAVQSVVAGGDATTVNAVPAEGYKFLRWSDGYPEASRRDLAISRTMNITAVFTKQTFTVIFYYPDGTTAREETVFYGSQPTNVPRADESNMQLYGYKFTGWDTDYTNVTEDLNIRPVMVKDAVDLSVEFSSDGSGALGYIEDLKAYYPKGAQSVLRLRANDSRIFVGWEIQNVDGEWVSVAPEGVSQQVELADGSYVMFTSARTGTSEEYTLSFTLPSDSDSTTAGVIDAMSMRANFVYAESVISFASNGSPVPELPSITLAYGTPIGEVFDVEDRDIISSGGFTFGGWYHKTDSNGDPVILTNEAVIERDVTLTAYWIRNVYTIVFLLDDSLSNRNEFTTLPGYDADRGGIVVTAEYQTSLAGALTGAFPSVVPQKTDYVFDGWYVSDMGEATANAVTREYIVSGDLEVVAVFSVITKDFTVSLAGAGAVYAVNDGVVSSTPIQGVVKVPVNADFTYAVAPSAGYVLKKVALNGITVAEGDIPLTDNMYFGTINVNTIVTSEKLSLEVTFELNAYSVNVVNGSTGLVGTVEYYVSGTSGDGSWTTNTAAAFTVSVPSGGSLVMRITASEGNYISVLSVDSHSETLPDNAESYVFTVADVTGNTSVEISYRGLFYDVTLPDGVDFATISGPAETSFQKGTNPGIYDVEADEGHYISAIRVNGTVLDPYVFFSTAITGGCRIFGFEVNGEEISASDAAGDYRITSVTFRIESISRDTVIEVETDDLYYKINTSYFGGEGSVTESFIVGYGETAEVVAITDNIYSVASVEVNGVVENYPGRLSSVTYTTPEVTRDYNIVFNFVRTLQTVTFTTNDVDMKLSYNGSAVSVSAVTTVADIPRGTSPTFTVIAPSDAVLDSITVHTASGTSYPEVIGYGVTEHTMTFDAIDSDFSVEIALSDVVYDVIAVAQDGGGSVVTLQGTSSVTCDGLLNETGVYRAPFGGSANVTAFLVTNRTLTLDNIAVENVSGGDYSYVASASGETGENYGAYTVEMLGNQCTVNVYGIRSDIRIYLYFCDTSATDGTVKFGSTGSGTLYALSGGVSVSSGAVLPVGTEIEFSAGAAAGAVLEGYLVNGEFVAASDTLTYTVKEGVNGVYAVFGEVRRYILVNLTSGSGSVNSDVVYVTDGEGFSIRFIPAAGYSLGNYYVSYGSTSRRDPDPSEITVYSGGVVQWNFPAGTAYSGDITVNASFTANNYTLTLSYSSGGTVSGSEQGSNYTYATAVSMNISANDGYYIRSVSVGGLSYSPSQLTNAVLDGSTNCFVSGTLNFRITGDTAVVVEFSPNAYTMIISDTLGGTTFVSTDADGSSGYVDTDSLTFGASETLMLKMIADEGYHVAELIINGTNVWDWQIAGVSENEMTEIFYNLGRRSDTLSVRVVYEINRYYIDVNAFNSSPNFASRDTDPSTFGVVTVTGYTASDNGLYEDIAHGSDVRIVVTPRSARGYYVESVAIYYVDAHGVSGIITLSREQMPVTGGAYLIEGISYNVTSLSVEFKRYQYSFDIEESVINASLDMIPSGLYAFNGAVSVEFYNPYDRNAAVVSENGLYEYGLNYTVIVNPGTGYDRTGFTINGEDLSASVRNNAVSGVLTANVVAKAAFDIKRHTVTFGSGALNGAFGEIVLQADMEDGSVFSWTPSAQHDGMFALSSGVIWAAYDGNTTVLTATYGSVIRLIATPDFENSGSVISSFTIKTDFSSQNVNCENPSMETAETHTVAGETLIDVTFDIKTYSFTITASEGGNADVAVATVRWGEDFKLTYELYTGYELDGLDADDRFTVTVDGIAVSDEILNEIRSLLFVEGAVGSYTFQNVRGDYVITIAPARKKHIATFTGGYAQIHPGSSDVRAVAELQISGGRTFSTASLGADEIPSSWTPSGQGGADYDGMRFNDRITIVLTPPEGYDLIAVVVTMGDAVYSLEDFTFVGGTYQLVVNAVKDDLLIDVTYALRQYSVSFSATGSGGAHNGINVDGGVWQTGDKIGHHSAIVIYFNSNPGYYMSSLSVNGISYAIGYGVGYNVVPEKNGGSYSYAATFTVNDAFVNALSEIEVDAVFSPQSYAVTFAVNRREYADGSGDSTLKVSSEYGLVEYNTVGGTPITHTFTVGYEITAVTLYSSANWLSGVGRIGALSGVNYGEKTGSNQYERRPDENYTNVVLTMNVDIALNVGGSSLYSVLDIHDPSLARLYIVYETALSSYAVNLRDNVFAYMVTGGGQTEFKLTGNNPTSGNYVSGGNTVASYSMSFGDNSASLTGHSHGLDATFNVQLFDTENYRFEGYQEFRNGAWEYVRNGENGITIAANGLELRYTMTSTRTFRAIFYRIYTVTVEIMPVYKFISGSFASTDPSAMLYRTYASITAEATYAADSANPEQILPDIAADNNGIRRETLTNSGVAGGACLFRIRSGAGFAPFGADSVGGANRANISFYNATPMNAANAFVSDTKITDDRTLYAGDPSMAVYLSFLSESYGANNSNAGGNLNVTLSSNSYRVSAGATTIITVTPNSGYRVEAIGYLIDTGVPDENGYRRFTTEYKMFTPGTGEGNFNIGAEAANGSVTITVSPVTENMIIKIRYVKQVTVSRSVALFDGKSVKPYYANATVFGDTWQNEKAVFDYGTTVNFSVVEGLLNSAAVNTGLNTRYRFMGYMINGVMQYTELTRAYPASTDGSFVLDDLGGKLNGASITANNTAEGTEYRLDVVAVFEPVYTIVVENVYRYVDDSDVWRYEAAGDIVVTTTLYNSERPQYYESATQVESYLGGESTKQTVQVLEQLNGMTGSAYNSFNDVTVTLSWSGSGMEDGFVLQGWQYYYYRGEQYGGWGWGFIPDASGDISAATHNNFTFPVSVLYANSYLPKVGSDNAIAGDDDNYLFYSDPAMGDYVFGDVGAYCIIVRPLFEKQNRLAIVPSVAIQEAGSYIDNAGGQSASIDGTAYPEASFAAGTTQTARPNTFDDYIFDGWWVAVGNSRIPLEKTGDWEKVLPDGCEVELEYRYNADDTLNVIMNDSYTIYARYTRKYTMNVSVQNVSGDAQSLQSILPYMNIVYKENSSSAGVEIAVGDYFDGRRLTDYTMPVGSTLEITLSFDAWTNVRGDITKFNPVYDRVYGISVTDVQGEELFGTSSIYNDSHNSKFDTAYFNDRLPANALLESEFQSYVEMITGTDGIKLVITANTSKRVGINFMSYGELILHNVYKGSDVYGSGIRLPADFAMALGADSADATEYWVYDGGAGDADGTVNGEISIINIPISTDVNFDKQSSGDFWVRIDRGTGRDLTIDTSNQISKLNFNLNGNDTATDYFVKIQHVFFYDDPTPGKTYDYISFGDLGDGTVGFITNTGVALPTGIIDAGYAFAGGIGNVSEPLLISTAQQMEGLNNIHRGMDGDLSGVYFALKNSIDLSSNFSGMIGADFENASGMRTNGFKGNFDGRNYTLYNVSIGQGVDYVGIFSKLGEGSLVANLYVSGSVQGQNYVGLLAGELFAGTVSSVNGIARTNGNSSTIAGENYVGGLIGYMRGTASTNAVVNNPSFTNGLVNAISGGKFDTTTFAYTGGAGGIAGAIGSYAYIEGNAVMDGSYAVTGTSRVTNVTVISSMVSGQVAGSLENTDASSSGAGISRMIVDGVNYDSSDNQRGVGGIAGSIGTNRNVENSYFLVNNDISIYSAQASGTYSNFNSPEQGVVYQLGVGAITARNLGKIANCYVLGTSDGVTLNFTGAFIGGIAGVNMGSITDSGVRNVKLYSNRSGNVMTAFGGIAGVNWSNGKISNCSFDIAGGASGTDLRGEAAIELTTGGYDIYDPVANYTAGSKEGNGLPNIYEMISVTDASNVYLSLGAGYNYGTIESGSFSGNLLLNRRTNDTATGATYIGGVAADNRGSVSNVSSVTTDIDMLHYIYVDAGTRDTVEAPQVLYVGRVYGSGNAASAGEVNGAVSIQYLGAGQIYNGATNEHVFSGSKFGDGAQEGAATVICSEGTDTVSAVSLMPNSPNGEDNLDALEGAAAWISDFIEEESGDWFGLGWFASIKNYTGYGRYIAVTVS